MLNQIKFVVVKIERLPCTVYIPKLSKSDAIRIIENQTQSSIFEKILNKLSVSSTSLRDIFYEFPMAGKSFITEAISKITGREIVDEIDQAFETRKISK